MDVAEYQEVENLNPYYLAAKYGGSRFLGYTMANTTPLSWANTTPRTATSR